MKQPHRFRILVLYDPYSVWTNFVSDHLASFKEHLPHDVWYAAATCELPLKFDLDAFDVIVVHFCVRVAIPNHLSPAFAAAIKSFDGLKLLFIQDEYDTPLLASQWIRDMGIHAVFSCVPEADREAFYPRTVVGDVRFVQTLTGYVSKRLANWPKPPPLAERPIVVGYRGRELPFRYGLLAREKLTIGKLMRAICEDRGIAHDIEWNEEKRLGGDAWYAFLERSRVTLMTESGSNIVDGDGSLSRTLIAAIREQPALTFEQAFDQYLRPHEGRVHMNQVPPKLFEAIALRTALVMFEGDYSGVVRPGEHFISLKKDFSNIDDVLARVADVHSLQAMADRAYRDVIATGRYEYSVLMKLVDQEIEREPTRRATRAIPTSRWRAVYLQPHREPISWTPGVRPPHIHGWARRNWRRLPSWFRWMCRPAVRLFVKAEPPSPCGPISDGTGPQALVNAAQIRSAA